MNVSAADAFMGIFGFKRVPDMNDMLPLYQCHKVVRAAKISQIPKVQTDWTSIVLILTVDDKPQQVVVSREWIEKHRPQANGYFVRYDDGYTSYSPKEAFESGYHEISETKYKDGLLNFGTALELLKKGEKVARLGWNGKGMWLSMSGPLEGRRISADKFWSANNAAYAAQCPDGEATVLPCITMKTADGSILMGWLASQTDMLAEDWVIVRDQA